MWKGLVICAELDICEGLVNWKRLVVYGVGNVERVGRLCGAGRLRLAMWKGLVV